MLMTREVWLGGALNGYLELDEHFRSVVAMVLSFLYFELSPHSASLGARHCFLTLLARVCVLLIGLEAETCQG